jgi:hypothetical protein
LLRLVVLVAGGGACFEHPSARPFGVQSIDLIEANQRRGEWTNPPPAAPSTDASMQHARFAFTAGSRYLARSVHILRSRPNDLAGELNWLVAICG